MSTRRRGQSLAIAAVAALGLAVVACGGDDDASDSTAAEGTAAEDTAAEDTAAEDTAAEDTAAEDTAAEDTAAEGTAGDTEETAGESPAAADGEPIKLGFALAQTGSLATTYAPAAEVAQAWASWVNDNGGINGRPVEIVIEDSAGDATQGQAAVRALVEEDEVAALIFSDTGAETVMGQYANEQGVTVIGASGFSTETWSALPNHISMGTTIPTTILGQGTAAAEVGATSFGAFVCAESPACAESEPFYQSAADNGGLEFASFLTVAAADADYIAPCLTLIDEGTDYMQMSIPVSVAIRVMEDCVAQGYDGYFGTAAVSFAPSEYDAVGGVRMAGTLNAFPWWVDAPGVAEFRDVMAEYSPDTDYQNTANTSTWSALELFRKAVEGLDEVSRETILEGYYSLDGETLDGLLPQPLTFVAGEPAPKVPCYWMYSYEAGSPPTLVAPETSGNGAEGDLATWCDEA